MVHKVNRIVICKQDYKSKEDFENAIKEAIMVLINNNYIATIKYDEKGLGIVAIDYNYVDQSFGERYPYWLFPEEYESIIWEED